MFIKKHAPYYADYKFHANPAAEPKTQAYELNASVIITINKSVNHINLLQQPCTKGISLRSCACIFQKKIFNFL